MSKLSERRKEVREYTVDQAEQELARLHKQLFELRMQQQRGEVKNNRQFTQVRTDIGRVKNQLTLLELTALEEEAAEVEEVIEEELEEAEEAEEIEAAEEEEEGVSEEEEEEEADVENKAARPAELPPAEEAEAEEEA